MVEISRKAVLLMKDQINFTLEKFSEKELRDFFKSAIGDLLGDLESDTTDKMKRGLRESADFFSELRIDERLRLLIVIKEVLFETLSSLNIYTSPTAKRISELIDENILELSYHYEIEMMKSETGDVVVADEIADELYKTRKKLEKQKNFITSLLENSPDAITLLDAKRRVTLWNDAAKELIGYRQTQIIGKSLEKISAEDSDLRSVLREAEKKGKVLGSELSIKTQDGRLLPVSVSVSTIDNAAEKEANFVVVMRDASELRKMRDRAIDAEKLSAMAKIAGAVAHEVRNPLNSLILNLDLLEDEITTEKTERLENQLKIFREEIEKLNEIVTNYLSLSRLTKIEFKTFAIREVVHDAVRRAKAAAELSQKKVHFKFPLGMSGEQADEIFVMLDERQFARVLLNLFQNALDALSAAPKPKEIEVLIFQEANLAVIEIRDTGEGLAEENFEKLFTPFYSTKSGGTGLGLYIVREIILSHRGDIELKNRTDRRGALVRITLPLAEKAEKTLEEIKPDAAFKSVAAVNI